MAQDFLSTYKYGWKTSYYQNTYDIKTDEVGDTLENEKSDNLECLLNELSNAKEESVNPVQFKVSPINSKKMNNLKGIPSLTQRSVTQKNNLCFLVNL